MVWLLRLLIGDGDGALDLFEGALSRPIRALKPVRSSRDRIDIDAP
jgi:hypothetical protein